MDLGPSGTLGVVPDYQLETVSNLTTSSGATTLTFVGRQDPGWDALDNVDVEQNRAGGTSVPEPATLALFGAGLAGLGVFRRRRKAEA